VEKAPPLALVPPPEQAPPDDAEVVRRWAAEPAKRPAKTVTIEGSAVPWRVATPPSGGVTVSPAGTLSPAAPLSPTGTLFGVGREPPAAAPPKRITADFAGGSAGPQREPIDLGVPAAQGPAPTSALRVGRYEVAVRIARGAMGSVYVCRDTTRPNAGLLTLKVVRQHAVKEELAIASFEHEARIGTLYRHPNAQTVIDRGVFEGQPYLVLDYVDGGCLADLLTDETRPPPAIVVTIVLDILAALGALHRATDNAGKLLGLLHCDVSPENVLIGVDGVARLADFGSARFSTESDRPQPFSLSKPPWMPPEQFTGDRLDSSSDVYSAGVLLWTALTGHQPFASESYDETVMSVMGKKIPAPSALGAPACLDGVCMQAMSRSRDRRFLLADAMAGALRGTAEGENLVASREMVSKWVQGAVGEELSERRRLIAAAFGSAASPRDAHATADPSAHPGTSRRERPRTPPGAEKVLSARTIFMPAAEDPLESKAPEEPAAPRSQLPEQKRLIAVIVVAVALTVTFSLGLVIKSLVGGRHAPADQDRLTETVPSAVTPTPRAQPVEPPSPREQTTPAQPSQGP
jgi:serine/threonine-protein kinase